MIDEHLDRVEQRILAAGRGDHFFSAVIGIEIHGVTVHDRIAQLGRAGHSRVLGEVALDGGDGSIFDVLRRSEMRLAGAKVDHVDALRAQFVSLGHDCHRG